MRVTIPPSASHVQCLRASSRTRVHTSRDSLAALRGDGIDEVATLLARAVEALA